MFFCCFYGAKIGGSEDSLITKTAKKTAIFFFIHFARTAKKSNGFVKTATGFAKTTTIFVKTTKQRCETRQCYILFFKCYTEEYLPDR